MQHYIRFLWARKNHRHLLRYGHWPEWVGEGGLLACVKCARPKPMRQLILVKARSFVPFAG